MDRIMVVRFCVQRLKLERTCILEGAQRIYTSEKFAILRFCMFTYQLDLGSLAIWQYSLRTSCDYLRGAPGSAALHDASWRRAGSIQGQPSALNRSVPEFLTDLMARVTRDRPDGAKEQPHHGQDHGFPHPLQPAQWAAC